MCEYTQVEYRCGHVRWTVRAWCQVYEQTHKRCSPDVVAIEYRLTEPCGDCRPLSLHPIWMEGIRCQPMRHSRMRA